MKLRSLLAAGLLTLSPLRAQDAPVMDLPMAREPSGTAWQPDDVGHHGIHEMAGDWMLMGHGALFAVQDWQDKPAGDAAFGIGWLMGMARRDWERDRLEFRVMLSPEPFTVPRGGYPLLLQNGETYKGQPLHDAQHPHDLFMEVSASWTRALADQLAAQLYVAPAGEPALGPVAFPHRGSAAFDPMAALGHHWVDSTHISFGVLTGALFTDRWKLELSRFNGREPDEVRTNFDLGSLDSTSGRISFNPSEHWSFQTSYGRLASPEALEPGLSETRATASASYAGEVRGGQLLWTAGLGRNHHPDEAVSHAVFAEATWDFGANAVFGRAEWTQKTGHDLALDQTALHDEVFAVKALSLGYHRTLKELGPFRLGVGTRLTVNEVPADLAAARYGTRHPLGAVVYLRLGS
ncbi:MAG TPA: hypothetical protein VNV60_05600 [Holophagaceae bacterium]|jgi:hypothetical protein|nr:hypothetical protein [Holophagaceae bacterium]